MKRKVLAAALVGALVPTVLTACGPKSAPPNGAGPATGAGGGAGPTAAATSSQMVTIQKDPTSFPPATDTTGWVVADAPAMTGPGPFTDPVAGNDPDGAPFFVGKWEPANGLFQQEAQFSSTRLSLRQYAGTAFGAGGAMPSHYRIDGTVWQYSYQGYNPSTGMGILAMIPYYVDSTHYVIVEASNDSASCWVNKGNQPGETWPSDSQAWSQPLSPALTIGDAVTWSLEVDGAAHTLKIGLNGKVMGTITNPFIDGTVGHTVCLASNGGPVRFKGFTVYGDGSGAAAPQATSPQPAPTPTPAPAAPASGR